MNYKNDIDQYVQVLKWDENKGINAEVLLRITSLCNFKCKYCLAYKQFENLDLENLIDYMLKKIYGEGIKLDFKVLINITGGEPFVRKDIINILKGLKRRLGNYSINIQTNATLIDFTIAKMLYQNNVRSAFVGFPSINKENYHRLTGAKNMYDKAIKGIHNLLNAKIDVCLNFILSRITFEEFEHIPSFVLSEFGKSASVNLSTLSPGTPLEFLKKYGVSYPEAGEIFQRVYLDLKSKGIKYGSFGGDCSPPICAFDNNEIKSTFSFSSSPLEFKYINDFENIKNGYRYKLVSCQKCRYDSRCGGISYEYATTFKRHNFRHNFR